MIDREPMNSSKGRHWLDEAYDMGEKSFKSGPWPSRDKCKDGGEHGPWTRTYMGSSCDTCGFFTDD